MQHRPCPNCSKTAHSSDEEHDWDCPYCGGNIPAQQKGPLTLPSHADPLKNTSSPSIPQPRSIVESLCDGDLATADNITQFGRDFFTVSDFGYLTIQEGSNQ